MQLELYLEPHEIEEIVTAWVVKNFSKELEINKASDLTIDWHNPMKEDTKEGMYFNNASFREKVKKVKVPRKSG